MFYTVPNQQCQTSTSLNDLIWTRNILLLAMESLTYFLGDIVADGRDPKRRAHSVSASPVMLLSSSVLLEILPQTS